MVLKPALVSLLFAAIAICTSDTKNGTSTSATPTSSSSATLPSSTSGYASDDPNAILWLPGSNVEPQPVRGSLGAPMMGPHNVPVELENADLLAPPSTDSGTVMNAKWPMALSHNRMQTSGWARQQNIDVMPIATQMSGVNMRLEVGSLRELHWHKDAEWAYVLNGTVQVAAVDPEGRNFIGNAGPGDLWYFPAGTPHSLQATSDNPNGAEFLLVFDSGSFSEDATFLLTGKFSKSLRSRYWLAHTPKEVIAKNFQTDVATWDTLTKGNLYIFPALPPTGMDVPTSPQGTVPNSFVFPLSQVPETPLSGGTVKIVDSTTFKASVTISAAEVTVEPGAIRELHWHPTEDEWSFFLEGTARVTLFASGANARTFDYEAGDVGYVPSNFGHYVENTGNTTLKFLEIFKTGKCFLPVYQDISLQQWLALTPPAIVAAHLGVSPETIANFNKTKQVVVGPKPSS